MEKDILQELTVIQQDNSTDKILAGAVYTIPSILTTPELNVADNFLQNKYISISGVLQPGEYEIISNTNNEIIIDYEITFSLDQNQTAPELLSVLSNLTMQFKINCSDLDLVDNSLVGNRKIITPLLALDGTFTIISNTHNSITISGDLDIDLNGIAIQKSLELDSIYEQFKVFLVEPNTRTLTRFECPTNNSFFAKYNIFTDIMIGYKNTYKIEDKINDIIGVLNDFLKINISVYSTKYEIEQYYANTQAKIALINNTIDDWTAYFERLKNLMSIMRIADVKVQEQNYQNMYDAKPIESQAIIDSMYNMYADFGREAYTEYKQELMFQIKID